MRAAESGGGLNATCYHEPAEEPADEPETEPPDPPSTQAEQHIEPDLPRPDESDVCPVGQAIGATAGPQAAASGGAAPVGPGGAAGVEAAGPPGTEAPGPPGTEAPAVAAAGAGAVATAAAAAAAAAPPPADAAAGAAASPMSEPIALAEAGRAGAVAAYDGSAAALDGLGPRIAALAQGAGFAADPAADASAAALRSAADRRISSLFGHAAGRLQDSVDAASGAIPDRLGAIAEGVEGSIAAAIEEQKSALSVEIAQASDRAWSDAGDARGRVRAGHDAHVAAVEAQTARAIETLGAARLDSLDAVDGVETDALDGVDALYTEGYDAHVALGPTYAGRAAARGEEYAQAYGRCMIFEADGSWKKDGFWAGYLTNRRAQAQQNAARETARGYREAMVKAADDQAAMAMRGRRHDRCGVIAAARQTRAAVNGSHARLVTALEAGRTQAVAEAAAARDAALASIEGGLAATLHALRIAEHDGRQSLDDTGYLQQVAVEQAAHAAATAVQASVMQAVTQVEGALLAVRASLSAVRAPAAADLDAVVARAARSIDAGIDGLQQGMARGLSGAEAQLALAQDGAVAALQGDAQACSERVRNAAEAFTAQMDATATGAASRFAESGERHAEQVQTTADAGADGFLLAESGLTQVCDTMLDSIAGTLDESQARLRQDFEGKVAGLDSEETGIPKQAQEAASHEQPAWKGVLAVVLIIAIIIVVALVIGPAVIGAVGAAAAALGASAGVAGVVGAVVGGAIVGAISSGALQVVQNFASGRRLGEGVGRAMLIGAATGALGGLAGAGLNAGLNALVGQGGRFVLSQGAQFAVRAAANIASDAVLNVGQQLVLAGHVDWGEFAQGMALSLVLHGSRRVQAFQARVSAGSARATAGAVGRVAGPAAPGATGASARAGAYAAELTTQATHATEAARKPLDWNRGPAAPGGAETPPPRHMPEAETEGLPARPAGTEAEAEAGPASGARSDEGEIAPARAAAEAETAPATGPRPPEEAMVGRSRDVSLGGEEHLLSIRRLGRRLLLILCSNFCGEFIFKVRRMQTGLAPGSPEWQALEALAARARAADEVVNGVAPRSEAEAVAAADAELAALREAMLAIQSEHPGLVDPNVPLVGEGGVLPAAGPAGGRRVDLRAHLPETATPVGEQVSVDLSSPHWEIPDSLFKLSENVEPGVRVEYIYAVRDNVSGEVLKIGSTADIQTRADVYARTGDGYSARSRSIEIQAVRLNEAHPTIETVEGGVRASVERGIAAERGGEVPLEGAHVLPWDLTGGRLPTEPSGPGIPGIRDSRMREAGDYWWRERKWTADAGPAPARPARVTVPEGVPDNARLGRLLRQHRGNLSAVAAELGIARSTLRDYLGRAGLTIDGLMQLPEPGA